MGTRTALPRPRSKPKGKLIQGHMLSCSFVEIMAHVIRSESCYAFKTVTTFSENVAILGFTGMVTHVKTVPDT